MTDKQYEVAEFETDSTIWNFKEDYDVLDEMVGANLARNINNQQLKKFYPNIPIDDYEESELYNKPQEDIDTVLISQEERPYLSVNVNDEDDL